MQVIVKNMVCPRCIWAVENALSQEQIAFDKVELGSIFFREKPPGDVIRMLSEKLSALGFELLEDEKEVLVQRIKTLLIEKIDKDGSADSISEYLMAKIPGSYANMSRLFSKQTGNTIEQFYHQIRIEKAKELLHYKELTAAEISYELGFSSPSHFSTQFKRATGLSPRGFQLEGRKHTDKSEL